MKFKSDRYRMFDSFLVLDSVLIAGGDKVYGILYNTKSILTDLGIIPAFVRYLAGVRKWIESGNSVDNITKDWIESGTGRRWDTSEKYVELYCRIAYAENPISYHCKEDVCIDYTDDDLAGSYIINEKLWKKLREMISEG